MKKKNKVYRKHMNKLLTGTAVLCLVIASTGTSTILAEDIAVAPAEELVLNPFVMEEPMALENLALPESEYGTFVWADGSYVPGSSLESCPVVFVPYDQGEFADYSGFNQETGTVFLYVDVLVSNISDNDISEEPEEEDTPEGDLAEQLPETTQIPQETQIPEKEQLPEGEEEAVLTGVPGEDELPEDGENSSQEPEVTKEPEISQAPEVSGEPEEETPARMEVENEEEPVPAEDQEAMQEEAAARNHTCQGITVYGDSLPWYVQFLVSSGEEYTFGNEENANIFQSYEFELWDTLNQTVYEIPDGQYVTVTVPAVAGYDYVIEHLLDNGAVETIIPYMDGDSMIFAVHSFSPFGIAGSKPLVGSDIAQDGYSGEAGTGDNGAASSTQPQGDTNAADNGQGNSGETVSSENSATAAASPVETPQGQELENQEANSQGAVNTGDDTKILPFVILLAAAVVIVVAVLVVLKRRK